VIATASADGTPNITYLSRVQRVDDERVALSNQFFSKTARNLAENPRANLLLIDPTTYDQYRLAVVYERTERRGPVFERLRADVEALAALEGMQDVFKLRAADIYRVLHVEVMPCREGSAGSARRMTAGPDPLALAEMATRVSRAADLDTLVTTTVDGLAELFGYEHSMLLLLDEDGRRLYTIASRGYAAEGIGSEVVVGEGLIGMAAARCTPLRIGNLRQMSRYSHTVRRAYEGGGELVAGLDIAVPDLPDVQSRVAVPALAMGQLVAVVVVESERPVAFAAADEAVLAVVASLLAGAVEAERAEDRVAAPADVGAAGAAPPAAGPATRVRFFEVDGSTFLDGEYLIKGVAGRILWALLGHHDREGRVEFTNRELRLDPSLDLPSFRDNFESRLILLKRRLDERGAPIRIDKTGRGRFRLAVEGPVALETG
jgi:GAF domain-containing protein/predicted pyridoxine 5'-phosphate oxidase superfamily flavin-nucleotide-binding protein